VLLVTGPGLGLIDVITGQVALTRRFAGEQRLYGLVLRDALVAFRSWPAAPAAVTSGVGGMGSEGTWGEWPGVVLTIVILMSPFTCAWAVWRRRLHRGDDGLVALAVIGFASVAGIAFAVRGGLGLWFNELVTPAIRAQNRIMPYLTFFALLMLLGVADRARRAAERPGRATWTGGVALALALSAWPSVGFMQTKQQRVFADDGEQRDRRSIARLLEAVAAAGVNAVLQVPVAGWPEVPRIRGFDPYRFQLPYVLSPAGSPTRWSYGLSDRQPEFEELFAVVDGFRERGLASAAVGLGFDAVLVEKTALTTADLRTLTSSIESGLPAHCRVFDDEYRTAWQIGATSAHPDCAVGPSYGQRYVTAAGRHGLVLLRGGWSSPEPTHVWTDGPVASLVVLPLPVQDRARLPIDVSLSFAVYRPDPQRRKEIVFRASGRELRRLTILPGEPLPAGTTLTISPDLTGDGPVGVDILIANPEQQSAYGADDRRQLGIALEALEVVGRDRRSHGTDAGRGFSPGLSLFSARESRQRR
jgi:hypothetical protein